MPDGIFGRRITVVNLTTKFPYQFPYAQPSRARAMADGVGRQFVNGKNPVWNQFGHERMGWALSTFTPATP